MTNYHDIMALSSSGINLYLKKTPLHYWMNSPFNPNRETHEQTPAMLLGSVCHKLCLEPTTFNEEFITKIDVDRRTKEGKKAYADFLIEAGELTVIDKATHEQGLAMARAFWSNEAVTKLLREGSPEKPIFWTRNGLECKAKPDYYRKGLVIDYKTSDSASPKDFQRSLINYGYYRQAPWYLESVKQLYNETPKGFVFLVQEKKPPYEVAIYSLDPSAIERGWEECQIAADGVQERLASGNWEGYPREVQNIEIPNWY